MTELEQGSCSGGWSARAMLKPLRFGSSRSFNERTMKTTWRGWAEIYRNRIVSISSNRKKKLNPEPYGVGGRYVVTPKIVKVRIVVER